MSVSLLALGGLLALAIAGCSSGKSDARPATAVGTPNPAQPSHTKPGNDPNAKPLPVPGPGEDRPKIVTISKLTTVTWRDPKGNRLMTASAKELRWDELKQKGSALGFSGQLYENGKLTATMSAPKAEVDTKNQIVLATGGVTLKSMERDATVKAGWVKWYAKKKTAIGNGGVKIKTPAFESEGAAFVADTALKTFTVRDSAEGLEP